MQQRFFLVPLLAAAVIAGADVAQAHFEPWKCLKTCTRTADRELRTCHRQTLRCTRKKGTGGSDGCPDLSHDACKAIAEDAYSHCVASRCDRIDSRLFMLGTADPPNLDAPLLEDLVPYGQILARGKTGLGTLGAGVGEAVGIDGEWWVVDESGDVHRLSPDDSTIFAATADFRPDNEGVDVSGTQCASTLQTAIDDFIGDQYPEYSTDLYWFLLLLEADLASIEWVDFAPSVAPEEEADSLVGTLVGLRTPTYAESFGEAPYHWHFVSDNRKLVGHVQDCSITSARALVQRFRKVDQVIPEIPEDAGTE